jgi:hypothetical protein
MPALESGDLGPDRRDWIIVHILLDEARTLINSEPSADGNPTKNDYGDRSHTRPQKLAPRASWDEY